MELKVTQLNIYPIKSLAGISLQESKVERRGLQYDRRWMLVDEQNGHLTQREHPIMALLQPGIENGHMIVTHKHDPQLSISFNTNQYQEERITVTVWADSCEACEVSAEVSQWFSNVIGRPCKLVYMPDDSVRPTDPEHSESPADHVSFADGYPILMFDTASVETLAQRSGEPIPANRYRGNVIFTGGHAHVEDELKRFTINGLDFFGAKPCTRCVMTTIDQETARAGKEPLKTLAGYRKLGNGIKFGQNVIPQKEGTIRVGDIIVVKETIEPIAF